MFRFNASPEHSVIKCSLPFRQFFFSACVFLADRSCLARKACSKDEEVSCSKVRQPDGRGALALLRIDTIE